MTYPAPGIAPYKGWKLVEHAEWQQDVLTSAFIAVRDDEVVPLRSALFLFDPTNVRFRWLVDHDFGDRFPMPFTSDDIDDCMAAEVPLLTIVSSREDLCSRIIGGPF